MIQGILDIFGMMNLVLGYFLGVAAVFVLILFFINLLNGTLNEIQTFDDDDENY